MKLLILGGTIFLGRFLVEAAQARGHEVTLFNRGKHNPALFPDVEKLRGDREGDLAPLTGRAWDAVIDTCGYVPRVVRSSAEVLAGSIGRYAFISSISVYGDPGQIGITESSPVGKLSDISVEEVDGETYGPLKALCEEQVEALFPGRALNIRPGLIVGPFDPTDRFTYWPCRVARGGEVLSPGPPESPAQFIDVRDLAEWTVRLLEQERAGAFNAVGPAEPLSLERLLMACQAVSGNDANLTWVDPAFLAEQNVESWSDLPVWISPEHPQVAGMMRVDLGKAIGAGLTFRPVEQTVQDTLAWANTRPDDYEWRAGLRPERELELLRLWHEKSAGIAARSTTKG